MTSTFYSAIADLDNFGGNRFLEVFSSVCADAQADMLNYDRTRQKIYFAIFIITFANPNRSFVAVEMKIVINLSWIIFGTRITPLFFIR